MATILTKKSDTASSVPLAADLTNAAGGAELAVNTADKRLYSKTSGGTVVELGTNPSSMTLPNGTANGIPYLNASKVLTSGSALQFDGSNLGLGVTPSAWGSSWRAFDFGNRGGLACGFDETDLNNNVYRTNTGAYFYKQTAAATTYNQSGGAHYWQIAPSGTAGNAISFTQAMTLDASGNLLVGTTNGIGKLAVAPASGTGSASTWDNTFVTIAPGGTSTSTGLAFSVDTTNNRAQITSLTPGISWRDLKYKASQHIWEAGASQTEAARIDSSGNLLVGVTSAAAQGGLTIYPTGSSGGPLLVWNRASTTNTTTAADFRNAGTSVGNISFNNTSTSYVTSSDYRLKENIAPMTGALAKVAALKPVTYTWKADGSAGEGFIAHELAAVCPQAVTGEKDAVDAEGKPVYQGIDVSFLVGTLTAAIQEQQAIIEGMKTRLAALESK